LCGGKTALALSDVRDPNTRQRFSIVRCHACELGLTAPAPDTLESYYDGRYYGGRHWITRRYCAWRRMRVIGLSSPGKAPGVLVDIGCGDGSFLLEARRLGWRVVGTEINARIPAKGLEIWGTIDELRAAGPFDCITLWHCLEHLRDPLSGLRQFRELLKPDGTLIVAVPNARGAQARLFGRHWLHLDVPRHLHHFGPQSLQQALSLSGFKLREIWHHEAEYDVFGWMQSALNCWFEEPNILFDWLTRRRPRASRRLVLLNVALGVLLFPLAFFLTVITTLLGSGGTIITASSPGEKR
jgi:SAM-dependent methyltransferase